METREQHQIEMVPNGIPSFIWPLQHQRAPQHQKRQQPSSGCADNQATLKPTERLDQKQTLQFFPDVEKLIDLSLDS